MAPRRTFLNDISVKAALYARVSTDDGRQTVANQVRQLRELAVAREFEIFREYTDEETGASANRASFLALLRDARLRRFRVLLITDLDRLTREGAAAGFAHLAELDRYGVRVVSLGQGWLDYDPRIDEDPELREMRNIQTAVALTWAALERQNLVFTQTGRALDDVADMYVRLVQRLHNQARTALLEYQAEHVERTDSLVATLHGVTLAYRTEGSAEQRLSAIGELIEPNGDRILEQCEAHRATAGRNYLPFLTRYYSHQRAALFSFLESVELLSVGALNGAGPPARWGWG